VNVYGEQKWKIDEDHSFRVLGEMAYNMGATGAPGEGLLGGNLDPDDNRWAFMLGGDYTYKKLTLGCRWVAIESDSLFTPTKDPSFGTSSGISDVRGQYFVLTYRFSDHFWFRGRLNFAERWKEGGDDRGVLYQTNFGWKF